MTPHRIGFLYWPGTKALTLSLAEEALRVAQRVHPEVVYELVFLQAEPLAAGDWRLPGEPWAGHMDGLDKLFLLADVPPAQVSAGLAAALKQQVRSGCVIGGLSAGVYPLAQLGLLDGYRAAVHWRWQDDFAERFPKVIVTSHLFDWDRDRLTACGGMAVLDLLLAVLARDHGAELAGAVSEELVVERIREGGERQRIPLQNRLGSSHPKLTQAVLLMEANIEEPLTTDEIAQHVCVSRRQLERIFKQYLNRVPSQYYLELRLNKARQLLMQTSKSIIQIGLSCGFSSGPHFSSAYRNFFGATPRDDRNQRRSNSPFELTSTPVERG
ncbi:HTH-type transcriptional regulator CdhR [Pseudomonas oleovorans subsp. oleovorans]|uniref:AraC family transcriptional regulator n=1 Tax=Ectopseudomonas oleovorans TaxID=301 RepID=A0A379JZD0_ECTOL|nr:MULTISPECIES: transcriptional regulator ArgR [Pseudomonas]OWK38763.1 HTH-type transcriptional regulator CdhR [Pseudomonas oleovorans subsp. oleovorans]SEJ84090.1 transcriptional regulator, AraC family [Pseudomonas oleovorans]SUD49655.1 AraC family transcriptional regulator [Pseudomonas oleovorans]SUD53912.1 AraC family transcriptional regulator [Pseudomonas oleovorans]